MIRIVLFAFVAYQLLTLPSSTSIFANGVQGSVAGVIALVFATSIWAAKHHSDTTFAPFYRKFF